ncbi:Senescence-specific cysteine protease SAG39-like protein [Drosera capensis]
MASIKGCAQLIFLAVLFFSVYFASQTSSARLLNPELSMSQKHEEWMAQYGHIYSDEDEKERRFQIFKKNVKYIEDMNKLNKGFTIAINAFADLTNAEFLASRTGYKRQTVGLSSKKSTTFRYENNSVLPASIDWRKKEAVNPIKDQGQCGSCWAFSTVASIEGITKIKTGKLISLSEQELVDCDMNGEDHGCHGGYVDNAFDYIISMGGITTETNYPYTGTDDKCNTKKASKIAAKIISYEDVPVNNEAAMKKAVAHQPVSVAIDASDDSFQFYSSGVYSGPCGTDLDHAVTVVGYGTENGVKYWLVKNSWGTSWGNKGYIKMQRDIRASEGLCGIAMDPSYPIA